MVVDSGSHLLVRGNGGGGIFRRERHCPLTHCMYIIARTTAWRAAPARSHFLMKSNQHLIIDIGSYAPIPLADGEESSRRGPAQSRSRGRTAAASPTPERPLPGSRGEAPFLIGGLTNNGK